MKSRLNSKCYMKQEEVTRKIQKYVTGKASAAEVKFVDDWYESFETEPGLTDGLSDVEKEAMMKEQFSSLLEALQKASGTF